ncbi:hypothetical protein [Caulobacter sp. NIBR1757]|uniref:hypothetical protein n=1 Tax=Caulobacter sp. NIBR1757 TaxID=3016000 RepID=UPI0022F00379|nr:hypothetical protein [Caulobacter sp. NIBR1757]WGM38565.1 hypothetical protein AMEJIAPC_01468 [Caulobacter sp. NIBR1757]
MGRIWAVLAVALGLAFGQAATAGAADWALLKAADAGFTAELPGEAVHIGGNGEGPEQWLLVGGDGVYAIFLSPTGAGEIDEGFLDSVLDNSVEALAGEVQQRWTTDGHGGRVRWARFAGQASNLTVEGQAIAIARPGTVLVAVALTPEGGDPANVARFLASVRVAAPV